MGGSKRKITKKKNVKKKLSVRDIIGNRNGYTRIVVDSCGSTRHAISVKKCYIRHCDQLYILYLYITNVVFVFFIVILFITWLMFR